MSLCTATTHTSTQSISIRTNHPWPPAVSPAACFTPGWIMHFTCWLTGERPMILQVRQAYQAYQSASHGSAISQCRHGLVVQSLHQSHSQRLCTGKHGRSVPRTERGTIHTIQNMGNKILSTSTPRTHPTHSIQRTGSTAATTAQSNSTSCIQAFFVSKQPLRSGTIQRTRLR